MPAAISDYLQRPSGGNVAVIVGTWVQLVNNLTSTAYVSTSATDANGKFTVNNVPAGTYTVNTGPSAVGPWTATGDTRYIVAPNPYFFDITDYGGVADGATDNTTALANVLAAVPSTGGTIYFPPAALAYVFASAWNLSSHQFVRFLGGGPTRTGGTGGTSTVSFTGTSGPLVAATGLASIELEDLYFRWANTFAGRVVDFSSTTFARATGCSFIANGGGNSAGLIIGLDNATRAVIRECVFHNCVNAVQGLNLVSDFSNVVTVEKCNFNTASTGGDISSACIRNPGQGWDIHGNTFELGTAAGVLNAIGQSFGGSLGVSVVGNWFGDAGAGVMTMIDINGDGWYIAGNIMGGNSNASSILVNVQSGANGITVAGNRMQNSGIGVNYVGTSRDTLVLGNRFNGVTQLSNGTPTSGFLQTSTGSGGPRLFGNMQRSFQSPTETVLVSGVDATLGEKVSVTLTAARLVGAPLNPVTGQHLDFVFTQGGAGAFAVTWNAVFKVTWSDTGNATGKISSITFWYNGTNWIQIGAQAPYV